MEMTKDAYDDSIDGLWAWTSDHEEDHSRDIRQDNFAFYILIILILIMQFQLIIFAW